MDNTYGKGDSTFRAAGGPSGVKNLVDSFYDIMKTDSQFSKIWSWHPIDNELSKEKLTCFLIGWMGGPKLYVQKYGGINIPAVHQHLAVDAQARDLWLDCMALAMKNQKYNTELVDYLMQELRKPAQEIHKRTRTE